MGKEDFENNSEFSWSSGEDRSDMPGVASLSPEEIRLLPPRHIKDGVYGNYAGHPHGADYVDADGSPVECEPDISPDGLIASQNADKQWISEFRGGKNE